MTQKRMSYDMHGNQLRYLTREEQNKRNSDVYVKAVTCFVIDKTTGDMLMEKRIGKGL